MPQYTEYTLRDFQGRLALNGLEFGAERVSGDVVGREPGVQYGLDRQRGLFWKLPRFQQNAQGVWVDADTGTAATGRWTNWTDPEGYYGYNVNYRANPEGTMRFDLMVQSEKERIRKEREPQRVADESAKQMARRADALRRGVAGQRRAGLGGFSSGASGRSGTILTSPLGISGGLGAGGGSSSTLLGG